ncbi:unnamed protein product [Ixodes pacificus]
MGLRSLRGNLVKEREPKTLVAEQSLSPKRWSLLEQGGGASHEGHWAREPIWGGGASHRPSQTKRGGTPRTFGRVVPTEKKKKRVDLCGEGGGASTEDRPLRGWGLSFSLPPLFACQLLSLGCIASSCSVALLLVVLVPLLLVLVVLVPLLLVLVLLCSVASRWLLLRNLRRLAVSWGRLAVRCLLRLRLLTVRLRLLLRVGCRD